MYLSFFGLFQVGKSRVGVSAPRDVPACPVSLQEPFKRSRQEERSEARREQHGTQSFPVPNSRGLRLAQPPTRSRSRRFGAQRFTGRFIAGRSQICEHVPNGTLHLAADYTAAASVLAFPMLRLPRGLGAVPKERQARRHPLRLCTAIFVRRFCGQRRLCQSDTIIAFVRAS